MKKWYHELELLVDQLIPYLLVILLNIIVMEFFFHETAEKYHTLIVIADTFIIFVFVVDLAFKYLRTRDLPLFVKRYWLDILAVFPLFLIFRLFEAVGIISGGTEAVSTTQKVVHEGLEVEKEGAKLVREGEKLTKILREGAETEKEVARGAQEAERLLKTSRAQRFARFIRPITRTPRFFKAVHFFEKPHRQRQ